MAESDTAVDDGQCRALTESGQRCSRPADDDGFCYQHDGSDPTVDDERGDDTTMSSNTDDADDGNESDETQSGDADADLRDARETAKQVADEFIDDPFDGIIEITRDDADGDWRVVLEVIERRSIPDTQDILGRYEVSVGPSGDLGGYRLTGRYRRGNVSDEQSPEP
ncbi:Gas vesicle synthesis protein GvpO [Natronoarchaeum philippinense]|uniref:Gas vesicle synthesis protein GvpO n=1 Tax=Natronoarchaeum philippinense TaxID=558529 RepID=A0A285NVC5_NATPI|nr:gas vesicle protein GvpO [Natronoarchaeum philippinense]SNZ13415.1 Gas vesicle synthesis protein GvpO [Natronoarchaeum philippinense]